MVKPWPIEIDGLPINSMVIFHGKLLNNQRVDKKKTHLTDVLGWVQADNQPYLVVDEHPFTTEIYLHQGPRQGFDYFQYMEK